MKKRLIFLLLMMFLFSCGATDDRIPLLIYDMNDTYMDDFEERIRLASGSLLDMMTYDCQNSQIIQNDYLEEMFGDEKVIIVNPVDRLSAYAMIEKAKATGTQIIFINREPLAEDMALYDGVYYVGADARQSAELQAEIVMELFGGNPDTLNQFDKNGDHVIQTVILKGEQGHQDAEARTQYVIETLENAGYEVEVLDIAIANFDMDTARTVMDNLIATYGDEIEVVIANNDAMAIGAIDSLSAAGYFEDLNDNGMIDRDEEPWMPVVGIDGLDIAMSSMEAGYLYGTVLNDSQSMAEAIVALTIALIHDEDLSNFAYPISDGKYIWIDYQKIVNE